MDSYFSQIINVLLAVLLTFFLNTVTSYWVSNNGSVTLGKVLEVEDKSYQPVDISNYTNKTVDGLKIILPESISIPSIIVSKALKIDEGKNMHSPDGSLLITISNISAKAVTRILIPVGMNNRLSEDDFINLNEVAFEMKSDSNVKDPLYDAIADSFRNAVIYAVILIIGNFYITKKIKAIYKENKEISNELKDIRKETEDKQKDLSKRVDDVALLNKRQRMYLLKRISEYSKEITFWRDTVRKMLIKNVTPEEINSTLKSISKKLDTSSTHSNIQKEYNEFEQVVKIVDIVK